MTPEEITKITEYIFLKSDPQRADLALVFGTRNKEALTRVFELYKNKLVPKILLSGGINKTTKEIEVQSMAEILIEMGVEKQDLILEDKSTNSLENVLFSKNIIEKTIRLENMKRIIAVMKHYHSRRAIMTLKKHFQKSVTFFPVTYDVYGFTRDNWFESEAGRERVLDEWKKIPRYLAKGDIEEL